ncbi:MAG: molybdopterin molybdotransferase MoeA, partial [Nitrospinota bacterium]
MISIEAALEIILSEIRPLGTESLPLLSALDRVLAEDIVASRPNPPWDNSAMDGYAVKEKDTLGASKNAPVILKVIADIPAGSVCRKILKGGEAIRIMTGAACPRSADAVVMVEHTERLAESGVKIFREAKAGDNIRRVGEDYKIDDILIKACHIIRPAEIAILASAGVAYVNVYQRPRVAVLSTGDELVDIHEGLAEGKIVNSNSYAL